MDYKVLTLALVISAVCVHCGSISSKISAGTEITADNRKDYGYIVSVTTDSMKQCTGVVLDEKYVLVPAHCVDGAKTVAVIELLDPSNAGASTKITIHENYNKDTLENDLAILELRTSLKLNENMKKIEVATETPKVATACKVSGYGKTEDAASVAGSKAFFLDVVIKNQADCKAGTGQICAGVTGEDKTKTLCQGDAGAPLVCDGKVVAIAVKNDDTCGNANADLFLELKGLKSWIDGIVTGSSTTTTTTEASAASVFLNPLTLLSTLLVILKMRL